MSVHFEVQKEHSELQEDLVFSKLMIFNVCSSTLQATACTFSFRYTRTTYRYGPQAFHRRRTREAPIFASASL